MKRSITFILLISALSSYAQKFPDFKPLRYNEDYSFLHNDSLNTNWYKQLKYLPLAASGDTYLSFGGDLRYQYFYVKNEDWGDAPEDKDGYILSRFLFHADFHAGKHFRLFVQTQSSLADGRLETSPVDENPLEVHQVFADLILLADKDRQAYFRLGRQEISFGSQRLVAVRDGPNNRHSFDAAKFTYNDKRITADLFFSHDVPARKGIFDDKSLSDRKFWGSYFVIKSLPVVQNIDLYYFGYERDNGHFDDGSAMERRQSAGTRIWGKIHNWRYDAEALYQFGKFGDATINAWTASINTGYRFTGIALHPEIGFKGEIVSGDRNYGDGKLETFNPLFPRGAYFGLAALIGPSNIIDAHPSISFELTDNVDFSVDYDMFWRMSRNDGLYAANTALIYSGKESDSKEIGQQFSGEIVWNVNDFLYLREEFTWFKAGDYLQDVSAGRDIIFIGTTLQFKF